MSETACVGLWDWSGELVGPRLCRVIWKHNSAAPGTIQLTGVGVWQRTKDHQNPRARMLAFKVVHIVRRGQELPLRNEVMTPHRA